MIIDFILRQYLNENRNKHINTRIVFRAVYICRLGTAICRTDQKSAGKSIASFTAFDGAQAVGMARLIGDKGMSFYIKDFDVIPPHQAKGVGTLLIYALEKYIKHIISSDWAVNLELISTKETVSF